MNGDNKPIIYSRNMEKQPCMYYTMIETACRNWPDVMIVS